jgi:hypothetical protein
MPFKYKVISLPSLFPPPPKKKFPHHLPPSASLQQPPKRNQKASAQSIFRATIGKDKVSQLEISN